MTDGDLGRVETWGGEPDEMYGDVSELVNGGWINVRSIGSGICFCVGIGVDRYRGNSLYMMVLGNRVESGVRVSHGPGW